MAQNAYRFTNEHGTVVVMASTRKIAQWYMRGKPLVCTGIQTNFAHSNYTTLAVNADAALQAVINSYVEMKDPVPDTLPRIR